MRYMKCCSPKLHVCTLVFLGMLCNLVPDAIASTPGPLEAMSFVTIPSGSFEMGSDDRAPNERPVHTVDIESFELMATEVTHGMWQEAMGDYPSGYTRALDLPACVSWSESQAFIDRLEVLDPDHNYFLPSESQWEYACRAGTTTRFYWGDSDSESTMKQYCWYKMNADEGDWTGPHASVEGAQPVGRKEPNAWGLYDMIGNVWEWCQDTYRLDSDYSYTPTNGRAYSGSQYSGADRTGQSIMRGGSWSTISGFCYSTFRSRNTSGAHDDDVGFRVARVRKGKLYY